MILEILHFFLQSFFVHSWQLFKTGDDSGIFIQLKLLNVVLTYGQGIFAFFLFGLTDDFLVDPLVKRWRRFWHGTAKLILPAANELDVPTRATCQQFRLLHLRACMDDLCKK